MIKLIKSLKKKYQAMIKVGAEVTSIGEMLRDLHFLEMEYRLKRIPKKDR